MGKRKSVGVGDNFSIRLPSELRDKLQRAADKSGQSLNNEIRNRLSRSFHVEKRIMDSFGDQRTYAFFRLLHLMCPAAERRGSRKRARRHWLDDWKEYGSFATAVRIALSVLEPRGSRRNHYGVAMLGLVNVSEVLQAARNPEAYLEEKQRFVDEHADFISAVQPDDAVMEAMFDVSTEVAIGHTLEDVLARAPSDLASSPKIAAEIDWQERTKS